MGVRYLLRDNMSSLMKVGSLDDIRIGTGASLGLHASDLLKLTHTMFIHLFIPTKKPTSRMLLQVVGYQLWAQLGSNATP